MISIHVTGGDPDSRAELAKGVFLDQLRKKLGMVWAKDLPPPKKKIRAPEDLLPDLPDDEFDGF